MEAIKKRNLFNVFTKTLSGAGFKVIYLSIIASAVLAERTLEADKIFFAIGCYFLISRNGVVMWFPHATFCASELSVSLKRIQVS